MRKIVGLAEESQRDRFLAEIPEVGETERVDVRGQVVENLAEYRGDAVKKRAVPEVVVGVALGEGRYLFVRLLGISSIQVPGSLPLGDENGWWRLAQLETVFVELQLVDHPAADPRGVMQYARGVVTGMKLLTGAQSADDIAALED
jgi:hypothetical protein